MQGKHKFKASKSLCTPSNYWNAELYHTFDTILATPPTHFESFLSFSEHTPPYLVVSSMCEWTSLVCRIVSVNVSLSKPNETVKLDARRIANNRHLLGTASIAGVSCAGWKKENVRGILWVSQCKRRCCFCCSTKRNRTKKNPKCRGCFANYWSDQFR